MRNLLTILPLLLLTQIFPPLLACSCIGQRTIQEEVNHADAVVVGTVLRKQLVTLADSTMLILLPNDSTMRNAPMNSMTIARYSFLVQDIYKGHITSDTLTIYTGMGGGDCGIRFEMGKKYILYGEKETYFGQVNNDFAFPRAANTYWTYNCLRTTTYHQDEITEIERFAKKQQCTQEDN
jgi:hypothetical protein